MLKFHKLAGSGEGARISAKAEIRATIFFMLETPLNKTEKEIFWLYEVGIIFKGLNGLLETVVGVILLLTGTLTHSVATLIQNHLLIHPSLGFCCATLQETPFHSTLLFIGFYFLIHGLVNIFLVIALLKNAPWAYPTSLFLFGSLIIYQFYRVAMHHSLTLFVVTLFDCFIVALIAHEYDRHLKEEKNELKKE